MADQFEEWAIVELNVWIGVSVEDQERAEAALGVLRDVLLIADCCHCGLSERDCSGYDGHMSSPLGEPLDVVDRHIAHEVEHA